MFFMMLLFRKCKRLCGVRFWVSFGVFFVEGLGLVVVLVVEAIWVLIPVCMRCWFYMNLSFVSVSMCGFLIVVGW